MVPRLFGVPICANHSPTVADNGRNVGEGLDVVDEGWTAVETRLGGVWRPGPGPSLLALDRGEQGGLLTADEGTGSEAHFHIETEGRAEHVVSEQTDLFRALDRFFQTLDRDGVLGAAVDVAAARPNRVGGNRHAFEHTVRVALEHRAVHERAGIAFVRVAPPTYLRSPWDFATVVHFKPVGYPPPPRPRKPKS